MGEPVNRRLLTDRVSAWEAKYTDQKIHRHPPPLHFRLLQALENLIDAATHPKPLENVSEILSCLDQILDNDRSGKSAAVIGCGPEPATAQDLIQHGYRVTGIEPIEEAVWRAVDYLRGKGVILQGTAEKIPLDDYSQSLVLMENVLEHVDSIKMSLSESYRILRQGGILFVRTTNRMRFSLTGINWEFTPRFYNWFPRAVKESYVFAQLHYRPELAYYSPRPAVHWFSFPDLCAFGREAGFARFYSPYDLLYLAQREHTHPMKFRFRHWCRRQPWIRAIAVSQMVGDIFMYKRK
jgi:SAM-dependent methyltransferase